MPGSRALSDELALAEEVGPQGVGGGQVGVADGEGVSGVGLRRFSEVQQGAHHVGDLLLAGAAAPDGGQLDAAGRVFDDGQVVQRGGENARAERQAFLRIYQSYYLAFFLLQSIN